MIQVEEHGPVVAIRMARSFLGSPLACSTAYWVDGLLIDTGPACTARELVRVLEPVGVKQIVLTHSHEHAIGGLAALRAAYPQAEVYASFYGLKTLHDPERLQLQWYRRLAWGRPAPVADVTPLEEIDNTITTSFYQFRAVETPGHTPDHISFYEPHLRWAFCGDAYTPWRVRTWPRDADLFGMVSSLRTLAELRPERLFPAGAEVRRTPLPVLHAQIGLFIGLAQEVAKLEAAGVSSEEMGKRLFHGEPRSTIWTEGHLTVANLVEALRSYNALVTPCTAGFSPRQPRRQDTLSPSEFPEDSTSSTDSSRYY